MADLEEKKPKHRWESAVERSIREAIERGEFDNPTGKGKPQDLGFNPFVPEEMRQTFRILKNAGVAPDWIEQDKEIRAEKHGLEKMLVDQARWMRERQGRTKNLAPHQLVAEHEHLLRSRDKILMRYRERAEALNKTIDVFNLKAPSGTLHHARIQIEREIQKFLGAIK